MKRIAIALTLGGLTLSATGCSATTASQMTKAPNARSRTVQFKGSDVQVSWNPAAKTSATLTYSNQISIGSNDAQRLITEATGCKADASVMSYPKTDEGFEAVSMPIECK